jgi:CheY-like chemotaxis protein
LSRDPRRFATTRNTFSSPSASAEQGVANAPLILIVDDDEACRSLVACFVESLGYRARVTSDPLEALRLAGDSDVKVVITDALMPKMDGRELCRQIKQAYGLSKKVILMTSLFKARRFQMEAFNQFRVDEYLLKPVDPRGLASVLARFAPKRPRTLKPTGS